MISYQDLKILHNFLHQNASVQISPVSQEPLQHDDGHLTGFPSKDKKRQCKCIFFALFPAKTIQTFRTWFRTIAEHHLKYFKIMTFKINSPF